MAVDGLGVRIATSKNGSAYIAGLYGPGGVAQTLARMGLDKNEWQKWVKQSAMIVASRATHLAPRLSGKLALSLRGYAAKKITPNNQPARYILGGVVVAQPKVTGQELTYAKAISFGRYYPASGIRTKGNPFLRSARNDSQTAIMKMWNKEIKRWVEKHDFDTEGFGGV